MATPGHSKAARVYVDALRVSDSVATAGLDFTADSADCSALEGDDKDFLQGKAGVAVSTGGWMDMGGFESDVLTSLTTGEHYVAVCPQGTSAGALVYEVCVDPTGEGQSYDVANVVGFTFAGQGTGDCYRGALTITPTAFTGVSTSAGREHGATTTEKLMVTLRCTAFNGTSVSFQVEQSSDNGSGDAYAAITTLSQRGNVGSASFNTSTDKATFTGTGVVQMYYTGATEAWKRLNCTDFSGTSATVFMTVGNALTI